MFKFMKSKKGFSLVELMIVVVIMAILVAVAVPIYNSVTANARKKTCIDNQRQIISSLGNYIMLNGISIPAEGDTFTIATGTDGDSASYSVEGTVCNSTLLNKVFQTIPYCPESSSTIKVDLTANSDNVASTITTTCGKGHQLGA